MQEYIRGSFCACVRLRERKKERECNPHRKRKLLIISICQPFACALLLLILNFIVKASSSLTPSRCSPLFCAIDYIYQAHFLLSLFYLSMLSVAPTEEPYIFSNVGICPGVEQLSNNLVVSKLASTVQSGLTVLPTPCRFPVAIVHGGWTG